MSAEAVIVRPARLEDVGPVLELWALARSVHARTPDSAADVRRLVGDGSGSLLVAETGDRIVGALIAAWDGWRGNMYRLAVHPDQRRRGLAIKLVEAGEQRLRDLGARRITALVAHDDAVAGRFWDTAGYPLDPEIGRRVRSVAPGGITGGSSVSAAPRHRPPGRGARASPD